MDVDFHYHATYVAARFAGYEHERALTIATSAQMIDENNAHTVFKPMHTGFVDGTFEAGFDHLKNAGKIHVYENKEDNKDNRLLLVYENIESFQVVPSTGRTASNRYVQALWATFHFLPGNFDVPANNEYLSPLWKKRVSHKEKINQLINFKWLCRPHSPMAVFLVRNCAKKVHDVNGEIKRSKLEDYLTGVTAHVFADTFAHQDFTHAFCRDVNSIHHIGHLKHYEFAWANMESKFVDRLPLPLHDDTKSIYESYLYNVYDDDGHQLKRDTWRFLDASPHGVPGQGPYIGHGQVGHTPDNSCLIFQYHPGWSKTPIIRNNPIVYLDAFVHLVHALYCIRVNQEYSPFEVNKINLDRMYAKLGTFDEHYLTQVWKVLCRERDPFGKSENNEDKESLKEQGVGDKWDRSIYEHGESWIKLEQEFFGESIAPWIPGSSPWIMQVRATLRENMFGSELDKTDNERKEQSKKIYELRHDEDNPPWLTAAQFTELDFFKFNISVKHHYRYIKHQLGAFDQPFTEDWAGDTHCYMNDYAFITNILSKQYDRPLLTKLLIDIRSTMFALELSHKEVRYANDQLKSGLGNLLSEISSFETDAQAAQFIREFREALQNPKHEFNSKFHLFDSNGEAIDKTRIEKLRFKGLWKHTVNASHDEIASEVFAKWLTEDYISGFNLSNINEPTNTFEQPNPQTQGEIEKKGLFNARTRK